MFVITWGEAAIIEEYIATLANDLIANQAAGHDFMKIINNWFIIVNKESGLISRKRLFFTQKMIKNFI